MCVVNIGANIRKYRKEAGYTQEQLANMLGFERLTIAEYENGSIEIMVNVLKRIAFVLGVSVSKFYI